MSNNNNQDYSKARHLMVNQQIEARGVHDERLLSAMRKVARHEFVPEHLRQYAYDDHPLPIGQGQTISQPYMVALMTEALELTGGEKVLEIGTGSGYAAAVLAEIAGKVITIERIEPLVQQARKDLQRAGFDQITVICDDGTIGWETEAPYDAIVVTAGGPNVPESLKLQLKIGGRLVIPVGTSPRLQNLIRVRRTAENVFVEENLGDVLFVPLIGEEGWSLEHDTPNTIA